MNYYSCVILLYPIVCGQQSFKSTLRNSIPPFVFIWIETNSNNENVEKSCGNFSSIDHIYRAFERVRNYWLYNVKSLSGGLWQMSPETTTKSQFIDSLSVTGILLVNFLRRLNSLHIREILASTIFLLGQECFPKGKSISMA